MTLQKLSTADCALPEIDVRHSKHVTILFTDLEDSTGLAAKLDAPTYADLVLEHVGIVANVVDVHAGAIHQFTGDGVLALWTEQPDGPALGLVAALALFQRVTSANACRRRTGRPWRRVRIGLHLGETVIASASKDLQNLAIGPDVNFARRVEQAGRSRRSGGGDVVITASGVVLSAAGVAVGDDPTRLHDLRPRPFGGCTWQVLDEPVTACARQRVDARSIQFAEWPSGASPTPAVLGCGSVDFLSDQGGRPALVREI
jgi:class 3 adenylate cyclase